MLELIKTLSIPIYLATNQDPYRTKLIKDLFKDHVNKIFSSCEIGCVKPQLPFFEHIEKDLMLAPSNIVFIDDSLPNIESAKHKGWITHHYNGDLGQLKNFINNYI